MHTPAKFIVVCTLFLSLALPARPAAASCGGTTTVNDSGGLTAAIAAFNAVASGPCVFTIQLSADITLAPAFPPLPFIDNDTIDVSLVIDGAGFTVDGNDEPDGRPFRIDGGVVEMMDLTVTGGRMGGAGIFGATGVEARGGGIFVDGASLTLRRCTVAQNRVETRGGGIALRNSTLLVEDSTIFENGAEGAPGAGGLGGGIYQEGGEVTIRNSTISGNYTAGFGTSGDGGGIWSESDLTLESVTITDNAADAGTGVYHDAPFQSGKTLAIRNSILALNGAQFDCFFDTGNGVFVDNGNNLYGGTVGCDFNAPSSFPGNPGVFPLADNGGPTMTHALVLGSAAIDAGDSSFPVDQRGVTRPSGAADDIGAFESQACEDTTWPVAGTGDLNGAIACFNAQTTPATYTILLTRGIGLPATPTVIDNGTPGVELVIDGAGNALEALEISGVDVRNVVVAAGSTVRLEDLTLILGNVEGAAKGGAILNDGNLTIERTTIEAATAEADGGAIFNSSGATLEILNSTISGNTSGANGGGIANEGTLTLDSVTIANNSAPTSGAGLALLAGSATIQNTIVGDNSGSDDCSGAVPATDDGNNLVESQLGCGFIAGPTIFADPMLTPMGRHGGFSPARTHDLLPGSPAIDAGDTTLGIDQRLVVRPQGSFDDIGAVETDGNLYADLSVTKTDNLDMVPVNGSGTYEIVVSNAGTADAPGALVSDFFPLEAAPGSWTCTGSGGGVCSVPNGSGDLNSVSVDLPAGASVTFSVEVTYGAAVGTASNTATVVAPGGVLDPDTSNNSALDETDIGAEADLSITKTDNLDVAEVNTPGTYVITVSNAGPSDAPGSAVTDIFPAGVVAGAWTCIGNGGGVCPAAGSGDLDEVVDLPAGSNVTFVVDVTYGAQIGVVDNLASVSTAADVDDPNPGNDDASDSTELVSDAILSATKTGSFTAADRSLTWVIEITNAGPDAQLDNPGPEMIDGLPTGFDYQSSSASSGTLTYDHATQTVEWSGAVAVSQTVTITIDGVVDPSLVGGSITNQALVLFDADGNGTNEAGTVSDDPSAPGTADPTSVQLVSADLSITKTDNLDVVEAGATGSYVITATNAGPSDAPGSVVTDTFPAGVVAGAWACTGNGGGVCPAAGSGNLDEVVDLPAGSSVTFIVDVTYGSQIGVVDNVAEVTSSVAVTDPDLTGNSATDSTEIQVVLPPVVAVPTVGELGLTLLALLLAGFGALRLRSWA